MIPADDSPIYDMLAAWEEARRQGQDVQPEELCRDRPELLDDLRMALESLKATAWMERPLADPANPPCDTPAEKPALPADLGEYTLLEEIGAGGMGRVYKALHRRMDRLVAVKLLPLALAATPHANERFQQEVR